MTDARALTYAEREIAILDYLQEHSIATTNEICALLVASPATVRRDFTAMSQNGLIARSRGCIQLSSQLPRSPVLQSLSISNAMDEEKSRIARFATSFVNEGDSIFIGAGKTCNLFASYIKNKGHLNVVTTNITVVLELFSCPNISLALLGGDVNVGTNFIETISLDSEIEKVLGPLFFDKVFITVDGIAIDSGYTIKNRMQIPLYSRLINASKDFYVFADSYKFDRHAFVPVFEINQIDNIITTTKTPSVYLDYYQNHGKNLYLA